MKKNLIEETNTSTKFKVNKDFAKKFEHRKNREFLEKAERKYGKNLEALSENSDSSSSIEEDENGQLITDDVRFDFLKSLAKLKEHEPEIYDKNTKLFDENNFNQTDHFEKKKNEKPFTYKDMVRTDIMNQMEIENEKKIENNKKISEETPVEEQQRLKKEFKQALASASNQLGQSEDFLKKREKTHQELQDENVIFESFLKKEEHRAKPAEIDMLRKVWGDESKLDDTDKFLRKYIMTKGWVDEDDLENDEEIDAEDEKRDEEMEEFEEKYNFRFEEPNSERVTTFTREIPDSMRMKPEKRKEKRNEKIEKKKLELEREKQEVANLKKIKKEQIYERLKKIQEIGGTKKSETMKDFLEKDFEPEKYDKEMGKVFNDEFFEEEEENEMEIKEYLKNVEKNEDEYVNLVLAGDESGKIDEEKTVKEQIKKEDKEKHVLFPKPAIPITIKNNLSKTEASELKNSGQTLIWWYCDECSKGIQENEPHFDCMTCGDFTLCKQCKDNTEHQHSLRKTFVPEGCKPPSDEEIKKILSDFFCCMICKIKLNKNNDIYYERNEDRVCEICFDDLKRKERKGWNEIKPEENDLEKAALENPSLLKGKVIDDELKKLVDEYYSLDFEDIIAGGIKTKFKYCNVEPESFGLTDDLLIYTDDKLLNKYVSIKNIAPFSKNTQINLKALKKKKPLLERNAEENKKLLKKQIGKIEKIDEKVKKLDKKKTKKADKKKLELTKKIKKISELSIKDIKKNEIKEKNKPILEDLTSNKKKEKAEITTERLKSYGLMQQ